MGTYLTTDHPVCEEAQLTPWTWGGAQLTLRADRTYLLLAAYWMAGDQAIALDSAHANYVDRGSWALGMPDTVVVLSSKSDAVVTPSTWNPVGRWVITVLHRQPGLCPIEVVLFLAS